MSHVRPPDDSDCFEDAESPGNPLVTESSKKSFSDEHGAEQARETPPADKPAAPSGFDRSDRCAYCGEPTERVRLGRPPKYCRTCRPRRIPARGLPGVTPVTDHTNYRDAETVRLHETLIRRYTCARPGDFVTTSVTEDLHLDRDGRIQRVDVVQALRATRDCVHTYLFMHMEETEVARVRVRPARRTCVVDTPRIQLEKDRWAVPLKIAGNPLRKGEQRTIRFRVTHENFGTPTTFPFCHLRPVGTHTLQSLTMRLLFTAPGATVDKCRWPELYAEPAVERTCDLHDSGEVTVMWGTPVEPGIYGVRWEPGVRRAR